MKKGFSIRTDSVVARSLKMTRATHLLVAAVGAAVTANAMLALQFVAMAGQVVLLAVVFGSLALATSAISADVFTRSGQAVSSLRSIGASTGSMSGAVLGVVLTWGMAGTFVGAVAGMVLGLGFGPAGMAGTSVFFDAVEILVVSAAATATGVYSGARFAWRS